MGKSTEGHDLWVLELSDAPGRPEPEPGFWYVANMHGDEPSGRCGTRRVACDDERAATGL